jgi:O-antigen/teichoic acid export membrane protein
MSEPELNPYAPPTSDPPAGAPAAGPPSGEEPDAPLDPAQATRLKRLARIGTIALGARTAVLQLTVLGGGIALARLLDVGDFGVFAIVRFALDFFAFFGEVGLGAALIRQKEEPTEEQLSTVFYTQLVIGFVMFAIVMAAANVIRHIWSDLPPLAPWLMRAIAADFLLTGFRIVPSIKLERHLEFTKLAIVEVVSTLSFYVTAVVLAALGLHVWALVIGLLTQGTLGFVAVSLLRPWRPTRRPSLDVLRPLLRFGLPLQARNILALVNGALTPFYAGRKLGERSVGLINWAQSTAYMPLKIVEILARVNFPLYARMQGDRKLFAETLGKSLQLCAIGTLLLVSVLLGLGPQIILVVYGEKWMEALPLLRVFCGAVGLGFLAPIVAAALDASGKPGVFFRLSIGWTALNWIVVPITTAIWPTPMGFVCGYVVHVILGNVVVIFVVRRLIPGTPLWPRLRAAMAAAVIATAASYRLCAPWATSPWTLPPAILATVVAFLAILALLDRSALREAIAFLGGKHPEVPEPAA